MTRRPNARHLNLTVLVLALALSAIWFSSLESPKSAGERYFSGSRYHGVVLEIQQDRYTERYKTSLQSEENVISRGRCVVDQRSLSLIDGVTGKRRVFKHCGGNLAGIISALEPKALFYEKTDLDWDDLLRDGMSPYSVDGIRLGYSFEEVEAVWGPLEAKPGYPNQFQKPGSIQQSIKLDDLGRVESISGKRLHEDGRLLAGSHQEFEKAREVGRKRKHSADSDGDDTFYSRTIERNLDGHKVMFFGFNEKELRAQYPFLTQEIEEQEINPENIFSIKLGWRKVL